MASGAPFPIRTAHFDEIEPLAKLWYDGWQDAHADILPVELQGCGPSSGSANAFQLSHKI